MLRGIRTASANWLGKIVMGVVVGFLALSFAVWGVGDIFRGGGQTAVASVGSTEISVEQFRQIYNDRLQQLGRQVGQPIRMEQARSLGLDRQILGQLISETALDAWAQRLGLGISDEAVAVVVRSIPAFHGTDGQFDHGLFLARLRDAGYTEQRFINEQRRLMIRQHLTESIGGITVVPKTYVDALNTFQNEQRAISFVELGPAQVGDIPQPTPEQLSTYFEERRGSFRAPEFRRLVLLRLSPEEVARWIQVTDADARQAYESRRASYTTEGRRQVQQITFPDAAAAAEARQRIDAGASFLDIAKARGLTEKDIDLGFVSRSVFASAPALADTVFKLPEGGIGGPVASRLGSALVRVSKIEPDRVQPYEEVADELKRDLAASRARSELNEKHDRIEDERAAGATLTEAAQKTGLVPIEIAAVDRSGRDPGGARIAELPSEVDVIAPAFATAPGVEADALRYGDGGYIWLEVISIDPSRERTLEEVKDSVAVRWRADQVGERLQARAEEILGRVRAGTSLADAVRADGLTVSERTGLRRSAQADGLPPNVVTSVFRTAKGAAAQARGASPEQYFLFRVTDVTVPALDRTSEQGTQIDESLKTALSEDLLRQYILHVERQVGTRINDDALRRVAGGEAL